MNILSICGGGVRGLIPLYVLKTIEKRYNKRIVNIFDYYAGSSIGAVIICGMLLSDDGINPKYTCEELYDIIEKMCKKIFSNSFYYRISTMYGYMGAKYSSHNLEKILDEFFGNKKIKDLLKPVCFPSFDEVHEKPIYFTKNKYGELYIKDVLRSVTAAPSFFDPVEIQIDGENIKCCEIYDYCNKKSKLHDSGLVANNPCLIGQLYATSDLKIINKEHMYHLCLGTGESKNIERKNNGIFGWVSNILGYLFTGYSKNEIEGLYLALLKENIQIVDVNLDNRYNELDNTSDEFIKYYNDKINEWLKNNEKTFFEFIEKLFEK